MGLPELVEVAISMGVSGTMNKSSSMLVENSFGDFTAITWKPYIMGQILLRVVTES